MTSIYPYLYNNYLCLAWLFYAWHIQLLISHNNKTPPITEWSFLFWIIFFQSHHHTSWYHLLQYSHHTGPPRSRVAQYPYSRDDGDDGLGYDIIRWDGAYGSARSPGSQDDEYRSSQPQRQPSSVHCVLYEIGVRVVFQDSRSVSSPCRVGYPRGHSTLPMDDSLFRDSVILWALSEAQRSLLRALSHPPYSWAYSRDQKNYVSLLRAHRRCGLILHEEGQLLESQMQIDLLTSWR